jgi:lipopolysaccharide transport system permease protein
MNEPQQKWTETIEANHSLFDLKLKEVWRYKDLIYMFVKEILYPVSSKPF